ncbi:hypothetical protein EGW08_020190 [Elysia chlorotica]|uniref:Kazal-like domain-containing protein n=1 Tax=Elysia chlorotica TaxID=188477 RepID=A0A433SSD3_ELYCH|nr:hypothetical protein EGW08_020190 [Elysia chlorotica]
MTKPTYYLRDEETDAENNSLFQPKPLRSKDDGYEQDLSMAVNQSFITKGSDDGGEKISEDDDSERDNIVCGIGPFKPSCLQRFKTIGWFTFLYAFAGLLTSALNTFVSSQITTLERYFNFSSTVSGFLMSCNDFGYLLTTLFMSYYSRRVHIPRGLGLSTFIFGLSGIICVLAFAITRDEHISLTTFTSHGPGNTTSASRSNFQYLCVNQSLVSNTSDQARPAVSGKQEMSSGLKHLALTILAVGLAVQGMAKSPRHSFLGTYIDDNVSKTETTKYIGIISASGIFGPAIAYVLGGFFSRIYVTLEDPEISVRDPRWMGAWWLGFLVFGGAAIVAALPLICFPRYLKGRRQLQGVESKKKGVAKDGQSPKPLGYDFKGFLKSLWRLLTNPVYLPIHLSYLPVYLPINFSCIPVYLPIHFYCIPVYLPIHFSWSTNILSAALGTVIGGFVVSKLKLSPTSCIKFVLVCTVLTSLAMGCGLALGCDQPYIYKSPEDLAISLFLNYRSYISLWRILSVSGGDSSPKRCVAGCDCDSQDFFPVCGADNRNYFSPCHAGCRNIQRSKAGDIDLVSGSNHTAQAGLCTPDCGNFYPYTIAMFLQSFTACLSIMPNFVIYIR